ncbi:vacuolar ATP synthase subunit E [Sclerotinia sclerotiorum 1980 UF-70]|uniref:Vacuolar ATP synthase subunit E n=1 Tax=Sclerotinia sclerotiorum (strain ATCC 18683 / 1980 / Ss-1) TaxID=665079 RepID=A7EJU4_SCLS1|nr:vacuolar ATP synthase subunit E [Sclerotinia sclerotiorum 1980 UF-70]EDO03110.1 vacuolar ATP synthase subunit E [Sclerotinia sclerotiorum 1980 UF-70]
MSHALSDDQVSQELKKMTAFIKQEAMEKGREIELKANEEFAIEKSKLVRQETSAIDTQYEKKFKTARMSQQITQSTVTNKTRLKVLSARQELLDGIFEKAQGRLKEATQDKGKYTEILKNLLLEGMYALNEGKLQVRGRKQDYDVIKKAIEDAQKEYKEKTKKDIVASIDEKNPLPEESAGGLSIIGGGGKIDINNTFEERLKLLQDNALPSVRTTLFGPNVNRKFYD